MPTSLVEARKYSTWSPTQRSTHDKGFYPYRNPQQPTTTPPQKGSFSATIKTREFSLYHKRREKLFHSESSALLLCLVVSDAIFLFVSLTIFDHEAPTQWPHMQYLSHIRDSKKWCWLWLDGILLKHRDIQGLWLSTHSSWGQKDQNTGQRKFAFITQPLSQSVCLYSDCISVFNPPFHIRLDIYHSFINSSCKINCMFPCHKDEGN